MTPAQKTPPAVQDNRINERKWGKELWSSGWTAVPTVIFEYQLRLGLDPMDINILLHIISYWWKPDEKPWPSKVTIARAMDVDPRTVQRRIAEMEKGGLIKREYRRISGVGSKTNIYHLDGLIKEAMPLAEEKKEKSLERQAFKAAQAKRKGKSRYKVVPRD